MNAVWARAVEPAAGRATFSTGVPQSGRAGAVGCGRNADGEPAIRITRADTVVVGAERTLGAGSDVWVGGAAAGAGASACSGPSYRGQPNAIAGVGPAGGDLDLAVASVPGAGGRYAIYVASANGASVSVAHSTDDGKSWIAVPVQVGVPLDDREWLAAYAASTSLLSFHDVLTGNIDVLRSDNGGLGYLQVARAIPDTDYKSGANGIGNLAIDRRTVAGTVRGPGGVVGFWAYQAFAAPASPVGALPNDQVFVAVSHDGGYTWTDRPVGCGRATGGRSVDHEFPIVSVAPDGTAWVAWSDEAHVFAARSADHGATWSCSGAISTTPKGQAIMPWIDATSGGVDLVWYGSPTATHQTWSVYFAQDATSSAAGWSAPQPVVAVHTGAVCEGGTLCMVDRQLFDDFGLAVDQRGWAHIAYSTDAPSLGGQGTQIGYAVQTGGQPVGQPN